MDTKVQDFQTEMEWKLKSAKNELASHVHWMKRTIENIERVLESNEDFTSLNSLGEFQGSAVAADVAVGKLTTISELLIQFKRINKA